MIFLEQLANITDPKIRLDRYMEHQGGRTVYVDDPDMLILFPDPVDRHDRLEEWQITHWECSSLVHGAKPGVQVYGSILMDTANRRTFNNRQQKRKYAIEKARDRRIYDEL